AYTICVVTDQPIKQVLLKPENSRRIAKWAIELGEHEILYNPRSAVKGHILADFLTESPTITDPQEKSIADKPGKNTSPAWTLFTDGAASLEGSGVGIILTDPNGQEMEAQCLEVYTNSLLIVNQVKGLYEAREELMRRKGYLTPWLQCVGPEQANYVLREEHLGSCDAHARPRSIAQKSARLGTIISDNGKQFANNPFREWCEELKIKQNFTSVAYPKANGQTEVTNRIILQGLKTRLGKAKGQWVKDLPNVLWVH
ncbi:reverse transcriptase domain-containing protein, partial [Tanacetum coccineum]